MRASADAGVLALGVLAHEEHVDVGRSAAGERVADALQQPHRPHVRPQVEALAQLEQEPPERDVVGDAGRADGAEQHRVELANRSTASGGIISPCCVVVGGAPGQVHPLDLDAGRVDDLARLGDDVRSDPVSCDHRDAVRCHQNPSRVTCSWAARG